MMTNSLSFAWANLATSAAFGRFAFVALMAVVSAPPSVFGQGGQSHYDRWGDFSQRVRGKVSHGSLSVQWETPDHFWYANGTRNGEPEYVFVNAVTGDRTGGLTKQTLGEQIAKTCHDETGDKNDSFMVPADRVRPENTITGNRESGERTTIEFINRTDEKLSIQWIAGGRSRPDYGSVQPGGTVRLSTYVGHGWLLSDSDNQPRACFKASAWATKAIIDDDTPRPSTPVNNERASRRSARSPDGKYETKLVDHNLQVRTVANDDVVVSTNDGTVDHPYEGRVYWSPNSRKFLAVRNRPGKRREIHRVQSSPEGSHHGSLQTQSYVKPGDALDQKTLFLGTVDSAPLRRIDNGRFPSPYQLTRFRWSADSSRVTFLYNQRGHQLLRLIGIDATTGETKTLISEFSDTFVCYSQNHYLKIFDDSDEAIWMTERSGWAQLVRVDLKSGDRQDITRHALDDIDGCVSGGRFVVREVDHVDTVNRRIDVKVSGIHPGEDPYHLHLLRVNLDGSQPILLTDGDGDHEWKFGPDRKYFINRYSRVDLPARHILRSGETGKEICRLETAEIDALLETGWRPPERFVAKGRDDKTDIHGIIIRPTNFDPQQKYPVIESIYAGPHGSFVPKRFGTHDSLFRMAELGFIVVKIDGMGTNHRGKAFHDVCYQNLHDSGFPDRIAWIKAAAETRPEMDLSRVGIYGGSAGGQSAMRALIDHGDFYRAAVADCGCHDNRVDKIWWNEQWMGYPIGPQYLASSNVVHAERVDGDLMLIVGELDTNVDPISTMQVVDALVKADKDFELLVMPGVGHGAASHPYAARRRADFFVRKLWNKTPRWTGRESE